MSVFKSLGEKINKGGMHREAKKGWEGVRAERQSKTDGSGVTDFKRSHRCVLVAGAEVKVSALAFLYGDIIIVKFVFSTQSLGPLQKIARKRIFACLDGGTTE